MNRSSARVRAPLSRTWWLSLIAVPLLIGVVAAFVGRSAVESDLQRRLERSVAGTGTTQVSVSVDGRDVTAVVPATSSQETLDSVRTALDGIDGVRTVTVRR